MIVPPTWDRHRRQPTIARRTAARRLASISIVRSSKTQATFSPSSIATVSSPIRVPPFARRLGTSEESLIGKRIVDLVHPDDRERITKKIDECVLRAGHRGRRSDPAFSFQRKLAARGNTGLQPALRPQRRGHSLRISRRDGNPSPRTPAARGRAARPVRPLALGQGRARATMVARCRAHSRPRRRQAARGRRLVRTSRASRRPRRTAFEVPRRFRDP